MPVFPVIKVNQIIQLNICLNRYTVTARITDEECELSFTRWQIVEWLPTSRRMLNQMTSMLDSTITGIEIIE